MSDARAAGGEANQEAPSELVTTRADGGVTTITLNSPQNANALSTPLLTALHAAVTGAIGATSVRVIVLTGTGRVFCAGADLKEAPTNPTGAASLMTGVIGALWDSPKPVVCKVNGSARAGGIGLIAACDIAIAPERATFAFSEVRIGVIPAVISVPCLRRMPARAAAEYFLTGDVFGASRAAQIGLLTQAVPDEELDSQTDRYVGMLLRGAPAALAGTKTLMRDVPTMPFADGLAQMAELSGSFFASDEATEGMAAFAAKRDPAWVTSPER